MGPHHLWKRDAAIIIATSLAALALWKSGALHALLFSSESILTVSAFVAGALFTSVFTIPLALASFAELAGTASPWLIALSGALGAVIADMFLFAFVKFRLSKFLILAFEGKHYEWLHRVFRYRTFRLVAPLLGAFVIASPLPDEVGLTLLGLSQARFSVVVPLSFTLHLIGIMALLSALEALA